MTHIYRIPDSTEEHPAWNGAAVTERARCIRAHNINEFTVIGTNTWILHEPGSPHCLVVDPGPVEPDHFERIAATCTELSAEVAAVVLTHKHPDHVEGLPAFLERVGSVPVYGRASREDLMLDQAATFTYRPLPNGDFAPFDGCPRLRVISLPGHCSDQVGLILLDDAAVLTGDTIFRDWSTIIVYPDGSLADYFASLQLLSQLNEQGLANVLLTGHGCPIADPPSTIASYHAHRQKRLDELKEAIRQKGTADPDILAKRLYGHLDARLQEPGLIATKSQLAYLAEINDPILRTVQGA